MSIQESIRIVDHGDVAVIELDLVGEKVNKLSAAVMTRLKEVLLELQKGYFKAAIIISKKENIFIAGADIDEIKSLKTAHDFEAPIAEAHEVINMIEDHPLPFIAAINGACLGGGCELALACDYRIGTQSEATKIGLPEVKLGIIPGFGGCIRLPRLIGLQAALDIILAGKAVNGKKAFRMGLIDECVPTELLEKRSLKFAKDIIAKSSGKKSRSGKRLKYFVAKKPVDKLVESFVGRQGVFFQAKRTLMKLSKGFYPAPLKALEVIKQTYGYKDREQALQIEREGFCEVGPTDISKNLIDVFNSMESIKRRTGVKDNKVIPKSVDYLGVLGAGVMGGGIAYIGANKGIDVRLKDINNDGLALAFSQASGLWQKSFKRRRMNSYDLQTRMSHLSGGLEFSGFKQRQVIVEAIVEDMEIKKTVIAEAAQHFNSDAILVTNTSSLSVTELAKAYPNPANFLGMHFFNPVHKMPLVEVIRGEATSDEATATIFELAKKMGKTPVVVKDGPGFLVNRLLFPYMGEALFMLEEGMAIDTVDRFYTHTFGMPMGPFRLLDEVGLDVAVKVLQVFKDAFGKRVEVASLINQVTQNGRLGKKNKNGFYLYNDKSKEIGVNEDIYSDMGLSTPTDSLTETECIERGVLQMINEAALALIEDRIVGSAQDLDLAMIMGTGFPPFRGGLLKYADSLGTDYVVQELEVYATKLGERFRPSQPLLNMAKTQRSFYGSPKLRGSSGSKASSGEMKMETASL